MTVEIIKDWQGRLQREGGLFAVLARSIFAVGRVQDLRLCAGALAISLLAIAWARLCAGQLVHPSYTATMVHDWANIGVGFSTAILGFLVTGFSIFTAMTKPELFLQLAKHGDAGSPLSRLQLMFYNFLLIFTHFLIYLLLVLIVDFGMVARSPAWFWALLIAQRSRPAVDIAVAGVGAAVFWYTIYLVLLMRGFIWNLYQTMLTTIYFTEFQQRQDAAARTAAGAAAAPADTQ